MLTAENVGEAANYALTEMEAGRMTAKHIAVLVAFFQRRFPQLTEDGKFGPLTRPLLEACYLDIWPPKPKEVGKFLGLPLPLLPGRSTPQARRPRITSGFKTNNPSRPDHNGVDWFYRWEEGDQPSFVGDGGCAGRVADGKPKWVVPYGTYALAAAEGVVQIAGPIATGNRCWIDHGNGLRSGYFHLETLIVHSGQKVRRGTALGLVGHNPVDRGDGRHLHFEVSPVDKYKPIDPEKYLELP